jgi:hypothetical protein
VDNGGSLLKIAKKFVTAIPSFGFHPCSSRFHEFGEEGIQQKTIILLE